MHWPHVTHPTRRPHVRCRHPASGVKLMQILPHWLLPATCCRINKERTRLEPDGPSVYNQYVTEPGDFFGKTKNQSHCRAGRMSVLRRMEAVESLFYFF
jgi:hypothetical protein